jgi:rare lipoprotein A
MVTECESLAKCRLRGLKSNHDIDCNAGAIRYSFGMNSPAAGKSLSIGFLIVVTAFVLVGCSSPRSRPSTKFGPTTGLASYYAAEYHGRKTASGQIFDMNKMTAAHRTLPFGEKVRVTNLANERSVVVVINDRGPFVRKRIIDVSLAAARKLDMVKAGMAKVRLEVLGK